MADGHDDTVAASLPQGGDAAGDLSGVVAGRYQIVRWLGGGGMGRVYEVRDLELDERVALKVLRSGMPDEALERFRREVKLTRRILHRNVARMFDIGDHAGDKFLTMELVDGPSLAQALGAPMTFAQLRDVALQLCAGLAAAHATGVVHRDLKPDNVLLETSTGRVVITDFGIARTGGDDHNVTRIGEVIGTPRYMAPEQLDGSPVDARTDLFALGVMLYELASGARPWAGHSAVAIAVAQATRPPRPLGHATPPALAAIIEQCLALDPDQRPQSASAIAAALAEVEPGLPSPTPAPALPPVNEITTIAVMPFDCAASDAYLAEGVREDLIDTLSTSSTLRVRPAGSVPAGSDARAVGQQLRVDHVVSGSVRRTGAQLRVSARLVGVADGFQIWAQRRSCRDAEVLAVSDELAKGVAAALSTRAESAERPTDPRAVELYLRARHELRRFWSEHAHTAADLLEQALAIAPTSVPILVGYAYACAQAYAKSGLAQRLPRARAAIAQALATGHGEAHVAAALVEWSHGDAEQMARQLAVGLTRAPMSAPAHDLAGRMLCEIGSIEEGKHHFATAIALEPQRAQSIALELARMAAFDGDLATERALIDELALDADPAFVRVGQMAEARLALWRRDFDRMLAASHALDGGMDIASVLLRTVADHAAGRPFATRPVGRGVRRADGHADERARAPGRAPARHRGRGRRRPPRPGPARAPHHQRARAHRYQLVRSLPAVRRVPQRSAVARRARPGGRARGAGPRGLPSVVPAHVELAELVALAAALALDEDDLLAAGQLDGALGPAGDREAVDLVRRREPAHARRHRRARPARQHLEVAGVVVRAPQAHGASEDPVDAAELEEQAVDRRQVGVGAGARDRLDQRQNRRVRRSDPE